MRRGAPGKLGFRVPGCRVSASGVEGSGCSRVQVVGRSDEQTEGDEVGGLGMHEGFDVDLLLRKPLPHQLPNRTDCRYRFIVTYRYLSLLVVACPPLARTALAPPAVLYHRVFDVIHRYSTPPCAKRLQGRLSGLKGLVTSLENM